MVPNRNDDRHDVVLSAEALRRVLTEVFQLGGSAHDEAALIADHLLTANLVGHDSHGVGLLPTYVRNLRDGHVRPNTVAERISDEGAMLLFDGCRGYGRRVAGEAMEAAIGRCREAGCAVVGLRNAHHIGRVGAFGEMAIAAELVSVHFVNVVDHQATVAPFGGTAGRFATNPVCIAVPGTDATPPFVLDMATSRAASGKLRVAHNRGEAIAEDMIIDAAGRPTTDPAVMFNEPHGAHLSFGSHKGSGLALACEILAGALTGGGTLQPENPRRGGIVNNMLAFLVDPARLVDQDWLRAEIDATFAYVKSSPPADPAHPVIVAGDSERTRKEERLRDGIPIDQTTWCEILAAGESLGLTASRAAEITGAG